MFELGQQALAATVINVPPVNRLSVANYWHQSFTKALKRELRTTSQLGAVERGTLVAAANLCCHAVTANNGHDVMLEELKRAIDLLKVDTPPCDRLAQQPQLPGLPVSAFLPEVAKSGDSRWPLPHPYRGA